MNIAKLDVAVGGQQASTPFEEMNEQQGIGSVRVSIARGSMKENVVVTKRDAEEVPATREDKVTPEDEHLSTSLASVKLEATMATIAEGAQALGIEDVSSPVVVKRPFQSPWSRICW